MATQIAQGPLPGTARTLPQQGTESPRLKSHTKWHYLTRLWTETITEFRSDMEATDWNRTTAITFYLSICCTWAGALVFMYILVPLMSLDYQDSDNYCAPDGSFRLESFSLLAPTWFFQVVLGFGSLNFTAVKTIDVVWDVVSCGPCWTDTLGIYFMENLFEMPVQRHETIFMQDGPSLRSIFRTFRDFTRLRGLRFKSAMFFMILTMTFVLAFPTLASAMTGYSANNQAVVKTDDVNQALFSQFERVWYVIHDGDRVNKSSQYIIGSYQDEVMTCGGYNCIGDYIEKYGVSKPGKSRWNETDLDSPTLNITSYMDGQISRAFVFENKLYDYEYFITDDRAICQPVMKNNQQTYQWGFSVLQLEITLCLLTLWTFGIYILLATAYLRLSRMGISYNAPGNYKSTIRLAHAIRREFEECHGKDVNLLTEKEMISYTKAHLSGGRVMVQSTPLIPRQSAWKLIWKWVIANKAWTVAFIFVSLSTGFYKVNSLTWLAMAFSMVAGWGRKTRNVVFLSSLISWGFLPPGYLMVILLRKRFNTIFGDSVQGSS